MSDTPATTEQPRTVRGMIESNGFKLAVANALPTHITPDRFVRIALTAMTRIPKLKECTQESVFSSFMLLSQLGLEPDGRNAHLIPYGTQCTVIIDYKGLVDLAMRSGRVATIHADKICENDDFEYNKGIVTKHVVNLREDRGKPYAYYAMVKNKDGSEKYEVMTSDEVQKIRKRSKAANAGPWMTDFDEMAKKTVFRRLSKWIQLSPEFREAIDQDYDAFEEWKFEQAKPAIGKPVIPRKLKNSNGVDDPPAEKTLPDSGLIPIPSVSEPLQEQPKKKQSSDDAPQISSRTTSKRKLRENTPSDEPPARPNEETIIRRLSIGKFTAAQFVSLGNDNDWFRDGDKPIKITDLSAIPDEQLARFLDEENFSIICEELEKTK